MMNSTRTLDPGISDHKASVAYKHLPLFLSGTPTMSFFTCSGSNCTIGGHLNMIRLGINISNGLLLPLCRRVSGCQCDC